MTHNLRYKPCCELNAYENVKKYPIKTKLRIPQKLPTLGDDMINFRALGTSTYCDLSFDNDLCSEQLWQQLMTCEALLDEARSSSSTN